MKTVFTSRNDYIASLANIPEKYSDFFHRRLLSHDFEVALFKMLSLDVDALIPFISTFYSDFGRPAKNQIEILRSFILMAHFRVYSPKCWVKLLKEDSALALLSGFHPDNVSAFSSFYDFINRFYSSDAELSTIQPADFFKKDKSKKPKNHSKLVNFTDEDTSSLLKKYSSDNFKVSSLPEFAFYRLFDILGVQSSIKNHLIPSSLIVGGDGTSLATHARISGSPVDDSHKKYSDVDADFGWDSDIEKYYFGYTGYNISLNIKEHAIDLPLFLTIFKASRHDALNSMDSISWLHSINPSLNITHCCFDSASDNYSTHHLLNHYGIIPIIDINKRDKDRKNLYDRIENFSSNGKPVCKAGLEMRYWGYNPSRERHKYRCPYLAHSEQCPHKGECSPSSYGRVVYIKSSTDSKLFGPVPYGSDQWKLIYKNRSCTERINTRIINDYKFVSNNHMHGKKRNLFIMLMIGINIHLDGFYKVCSKQIIVFTE